MQLIPAIDLLEGRCVRLLHGDFDQCRFYDIPPLELAGDYSAAGAKLLHVVDLAAARDGESDNNALFDLLRNSPMPVQTGGGVRSGEDVRARLENGAKRVVVGSVCATQPERFLAWISELGPERLVAALDVIIDEDGVPWPRTHGWTRGAKSNLWTLLDQLQAGGLRHLLCTDISRDGAMSGPNTVLYQQLVNRYPDLHVQASGGVSSLDDLRQLATTGATGAISGKALLEGAFTAFEAIEVLS